MKKILLSSLLVASTLFSAKAQLLTNGNLAVVRIGGQNQLVTTNGLQVSIDQYSTNGSFINSTSLPTNGANSFVLDNSTAEGYLTVSGNNQYLVLAGYNAPLGGGFGTSFGLNGTTAHAVPRSIATVDGYGNYVLEITNTLAYDTWPITAAVTDGSNNFWMLGENSDNPYLGVIYAGTPASPTTVLVSDTGGEESGFNLYNGSLFISSSFAPDGIFQIANTNTPATSLPQATNSSSAVIPLPGSTRIKDFAFDPSMTTCYYADSSIGIVKFTNYLGTWTSNYTIPATNAGGFTTKGALAITVNWSTTPYTVYATTSESTGNRIVQLVDNGPSSICTMVAQAFTNHVDTTNVFRGLRFTPASAPLIASPVSGVSVNANASATFSVTPEGTAPFTYQWFTNGVAVNGATSPSLTLNNVSTFESGLAVTVAVTNSIGSTLSSNAYLTVSPNYFQSGNLAVVQMGTAGQPAASDGEPVSVLQMTTGGSIVSTVSIPNTGPNAFILDNSATEGFLSLSQNNQFLVLGGYNTNIQASSLAGFTSTNVHRAIATIDGNGNYALPITNSHIYSTFNIRGATSDGSNFWVSGSGGTGASIANGELGAIYLGTASAQTNVTVTETGTGNERVINVYNNTLYMSTGSGSGAFGRGIYMVSNLVSSGLPTNTGSLVNNTNIMPTGSASGPYDFTINSSNTVAYVAEDNLGGIIKFTNGPTGWVSNYTISAATTGSPNGTNAQAVCADWSQTPVVLYATTGEGAGDRLVQITDTGSAATATLIATAPTGTIYRGVRFVPGIAPEITNQPLATTNDAGGTSQFTVGATGTPSLYYQWLTNGTVVSGATTATLTLSSLTTDENGFLVSVVVSNNFGAVTSSPVQLTVQPPGAPLDVSVTTPAQVVNAGSTVTLSASSIGSSLTFYWTLNGQALTDGGAVNGSSTANLVIGPADATYNGTYTVTASNSFGAVPANNSTTLTVHDPVILTQPSGSTNLPTGSASLSVFAAGAMPLTYQWYSNHIAISGAVASNLDLAGPGITTAATYYVVVSNNLGNSITSAPTVVSFTPILLADNFNYPNGNLFGDTGSPWTDINGTNPELVNSNHVQVAQTNATTDAQSKFTMGVSNTVVWATFTVNMSTLPTNNGGVYFANLEDTNFGFFARIFALKTNSSSLTPGIPGQAFPGTYRLGIANGQNDSSGSTTTGPTAVIPLDLAPGIDYRVVFYLDLVNQVSGLAINPAALSDVTAFSPGGVSSGPAGDTITASLPMAAFGLRQRQGEGIMNLGKLSVSFDWNGIGSGYAAVTSGINASNPVIGLQPKGTTNYLGNAYQMEIAASGIGTAGSGLTYAWYQNGAQLNDDDNLSGTATPSLSIASLVATNAGTYYVVVTGATSTPIQSSNTIISVNTTDTAPMFTLEPATNTTVSQGATVTYSAQAIGTGPITYEWFFDGNDLGISGSTLKLSAVTPDQSGTYTVVATGGTSLTSTSTPAFLTVNGPQTATIGYLRSLLNPVTFAPSDTSTLFSVTGVITTSTNQTSGNTASYYLQDSSGGINLFVTLGSDFRPQLGDVVTATGTLSTFVDNYELDVVEGNPGYADNIVSHSNAMPAPILLPWGNSTSPLSPFLSTNVEGSVVVITNAYFASYTPTAKFASGGTYVITNKAGQSYTVFVSDQDTNFITGNSIPQFAYSIAGPLIQDNATIGISFTVLSNLVVAPPPTVELGGLPSGLNGTNFTITWPATPYTYTYSVLSTTNLSEPFIPLASGLWFTNTLGGYIDVGPTNEAKFYEITSP